MRAGLGFGGGAHYGVRNQGEPRTVIPALFAQAGGHIHFADLHLAKGISLGFFTLKFYSLAYIAGILIGWWYLLKLLAQPGAPMARRHADDLVFYATLGIIIGGRLGYVIFYSPEMFSNPLSILKLWEGGMSFHGGAAGTALAVWWLARRNKLSMLRVLDYVTCCAPIGQFLGRCANFVNGELWGRPGDVPWAMVFPGAGPMARHPSQLYEAFGEGLLLFVVLALLFWRTDARYYPGRLLGVGLAGFGAIRFVIEFFREPDAQLREFAATTGLNMGQWLCLPMIAIGIWLILTSKKRRERVEPFAGTESVA